MAILRGVKINKDETFADGFREGYKSVMGRDAAIPAVPAHFIPAGKGAYLGGIASGMATAQRTKRQREAPSR
jgi:hypothetical protein